MSQQDESALRERVVPCLGKCQTPVHVQGSYEATHCMSQENVVGSGRLSASSMGGEQVTMVDEGPLRLVTKWIDDLQVFTTTISELDDTGQRIVHSETSPSVIYFLRKGDPESHVREEWYFNGYLHRENAPSISQKFHDGRFLRIWYKNGLPHRETGEPAVDTRNPDGSVLEVEWRINGKLHRQGGPAVIKCLPNGQPQVRAWYTNDQLHRNNGPAVVFYATNELGKSQIVLTQWWLDGHHYDSELWRHTDYDVLNAIDLGVTPWQYFNYRSAGVSKTANMVRSLKENIPPTEMADMERAKS